MQPSELLDYTPKLDVDVLVVAVLCATLSFLFVHLLLPPNTRVFKSVSGGIKVGF
jgi:hypothetical protein